MTFMPDNFPDMSLTKEHSMPIQHTGYNLTKTKKLNTKILNSHDRHNLRGVKSSRKKLSLRWKQTTDKHEAGFLILNKNDATGVPIPNLLTRRQPTLLLLFSLKTAVA